MAILRFTSMTLAAAALLAVTSSAASAATCYRLPFSNPNLSDGFGSTKGRAHPHRGVDFPQPRGKAIPAAATGTVSVVTKSGCLGNVIVLKHADGKYSGYSHMQSKSPLKVGKKVTRGQTVGKVGATGSCALGAHLHLTMSPQKGGYAAGTVINPYTWIKNHKCSSAREVEQDDTDLSPELDNLDTVDQLDADDSDDTAIAEMEDAEMAAIIAAAEANDANDAGTLAPEEADDAAADDASDDQGSDAPADGVLETDDTDVIDDNTGGCAVSHETGPADAFGAGALSMLAMAFARRRRRAKI